MTIFSFEKNFDDKLLSDSANGELTTPTANNPDGLDTMTEGLLLLDKDLRIALPTPYVNQVKASSYLPFSISPKFTLLDQHHEENFTKFATVAAPNQQPLIMLLEAIQPDKDMILLTCFKLLEHEHADLKQTRFMIRVCHSNYYSSLKWQTFTDHFSLTLIESRLCRALADGLTLQEYAEKWDVSINTARSQLNSVFSKTGMTKQTNLLRLIFLFVRA